MTYHITWCHSLFLEVHCLTVNQTYTLNCHGMNKQDIITRISIIRNRANLSARALSIAIGMNEWYISRLESKKYGFLPSMEVFLKILEECNCSPQEFFHYDISQYKKDEAILNLLEKANDEKKAAILSLLKN